MDLSFLCEIGLKELLGIWEIGDCMFPLPFESLVLSSFTCWKLLLLRETVAVPKEELVNVFLWEIEEDEIVVKLLFDGFLLNFNLIIF